VKRLLGYGSSLAGGALLAIAAQPAFAAATVITNVQVIPTDRGAQVVLQTEAGDTPQLFATNQGQTLQADIVRTQLALADGNTFTQQNPVPGISSISLEPLDSNSVRLTVNGSNRIPMGTIAESSDGGIVIDIETAIEPAEPQANAVPIEIETVPGEAVAQAEPEAPAAEDAPASDAPAQNQEQPDVLVPNPQVIIDGVPVPAPQAQQVPPFLPRAIAPPVGDIAVAETSPDFGAIDLGTAERVPRLVLREAPSREVLTLLARSAGLNLIFVDADAEGGTDGGGAGDGGPPVTLDIENESVQDVFNSILRVTGLQANRVGRSIYVGTNLPTSAQNIVVRSLRLNQIDATVATNFLVGLGAESAVSRERQVTNVNAVAVSEGAPPLTETQTTTEDRVETQRAEFEDSQPIFRGLQVIAEERTNSVTLVGQPSLVELATSQLARLDLRRRQVAINLKVIDVDLNALDAFGTSFSFSAGDADFIQSGGIGVFNFGSGIGAPAGANNLPSSTPIPPQSAGSVDDDTGLLDFVGNTPFGIFQDFILQLQATIQEGNAKILTDPTLIVQEGQTANVELTQDVPTDVTSEITTADGVTTTSVNVEFEPAGLILQVNVDRIDDNGFISLSVAPSITSPTDTFVINGPNFSNTVFLLNNRQLSSGQIRVRDGQTLLLSGIIQESERSSVNKIPILGDIPILGALFRSTVRDSERQELIVLLTPQILDDSDQSVFGYSYTPSEEVQELIDRTRDR